MKRALVAAALAAATLTPGAADAHHAPGVVVDFGPWNGLIQCESGGDANVINPYGYAGLFQFGQQTWDWTARHAGRSWLVGVNPANASVPDQHAQAITLRDMPGGGLGHWACRGRYGDGTGPVTVVDGWWPTTTPTPTPTPAPTITIGWQITALLEEHADRRGVDPDVLARRIIRRWIRQADQ